jgi:hypothetical protein
VWHGASNRCAEAVLELMLCKAWWCCADMGGQHRQWGAQCTVVASSCTEQSDVSMSSCFECKTTVFSGGLRN